MAAAAPKSQPGDSLSKRVTTYTSYFEGGQDDDDAVTTEEQKRRERQAKGAEIPESYYNFVTSAFERGWGRNFHFAPFGPDDTVHSAQRFYQHRLAHRVGLEPGMKVLDVGCGIGGPAREMARFVGCEVVGVCINQVQVDRAIHLTAQEGLSGRCTFVRGDFLNLPFASSTFDAAYAIEATVHAPSLSTVYSEVWRVLKPRAVFGVSEWVMTPKYDPCDSKHVGIRDRLERGNGLSNMHTSDQARAAMGRAGFDLLHEEDFAQHSAYLAAASARTTTSNDRAGGKGNVHGRRADFDVAADGHDNDTKASSISTPSPVLVPFLAKNHPDLADTATTPTTCPSSSSSSPSTPDLRPAPRPSRPVPATMRRPCVHRPWWWPLVGATSLATTWTDYWTAWKMSLWARRLCHALVWICELVGVTDRGTCAAMALLADCVDGAADGGREGIFSPCWWFIGRKGERGPVSGP